MPGTAAKWTLLASLYLAQGLPDGFFRQALPVLLLREGVALEYVGLATLLMLPWGLKFLWAPLVDRLGAPGFGRRRSWIVAMQALAVAGMLGLSLTDPSRGLSAVLALVFVVTLASATQDIAADGLAVAVLGPEERGAGNGLQVAAYRLGMILSGTALVYWFDLLGWSRVFTAMAVALALATLPVLAVREPPAPPPPPSYASTFAGLLAQPGIESWLMVLATWKFGEAFASAMLRPLLHMRGFPLESLALITGAAGFTAGLVGALVGGVMVGRFGRWRMLLVFGAVQALAVAGYAALAFTSDLRAVYLLCMFEHLASGMATAALFTIMMDVARPHAAGTDYTAQASVVVLASGVAGALSGFSAAALGFPGHFALAAGLCLLATLLAAGHRARVRRGEAAVAVLP